MSTTTMTLEAVLDDIARRREACRDELTELLNAGEQVDPAVAVAKMNGRLDVEEEALTLLGQWADEDTWSTIRHWRAEVQNYADKAAA